MTQLKLLWIDLSQSTITDEGVTHLANLNNLIVLGLQGTNVTDDYIKIIKKLPKLEHFYLLNSGITAKGKQELQQAKPNLTIYH